MAEPKRCRFDLDQTHEVTEVLKGHQTCSHHQPRQGGVPMSKASRLPRTADSTLLRTIAHRPFRRMLARQGIDPTRGWKGCEEMIFRAMRKCSDCSAQAACRSGLAENPSRGTYPRFCANGATFEACRISLDPHVSPLNPGEP